MSRGQEVKGSENFVWFLDQKLGRGAMGTVYVARNRRRGTKHAAKIMSDKKKSRETLQHEIDVLRQMSADTCKNIVKLVAIEKETHSHETVVVLELCNGGSLQRILDEPENFQGLSQDVFMLVLKDLYNALAHLYKHNIVHRDVKPGNILLSLTPDGRQIFKLTDFGTSRTFSEDGEKFQTLCGTEEYLHPDVYTSAFIRRVPGSLFDHEVDIWSYGVTLYQCATGQLPFRPSLGIRRNRQLMNELMTKKPAGVISRHELPDGTIVDERELPTSSPLLTGTRSVVRDLLVRIFDRERPWRVPAFFQEMSEFYHYVEVYVYSKNINDIVVLHLPKEASLTKLKEMIATNTHTQPPNQLLLTSSGRLEGYFSASACVGDLPESSPQEPLYVLDRRAPSGARRASHVSTLNKLPPEASQDASLADDHRWASGVCGNIHHFLTRTILLIMIQTHMLLTRCLLFDIVNDACRALENDLGHREQMLRERESLWLAVRSHVDHHHRHARKRDLIETMAAVIEQLLRDCRSEVAEARSICDAVQNQLRQCTLIVRRGLKPSCVHPDRCKETLTMMLDEATPMYRGLHEDKLSDRLSHNNMEIHKYNKSELKRVHRRARDHVSNHCVQQVQLLEQETDDIVGSLFSSWNMINGLEREQGNSPADKLSKALRDFVALDVSNGSDKREEVSSDRVEGNNHLGSVDKSIQVTGSLSNDQQVSSDRRVAVRTPGRHVHGRGLDPVITSRPAPRRAGTVTADDRLAPDGRNTQDCQHDEQYQHIEEGYIDLPSPIQESGFKAVNQHSHSSSDRSLQDSEYAKGS